MFIISWLTILVLRANDIVIPGIVSGIIGWLAVAEATIYIFVITIQVIAFIKYKF